MVLTLVFVTVATFLLPSERASAASTPKTPVAWIDNAHTAAVDASNNPYYPLGYACAVGALTLTDSAGTAISSDAKPDTTVQVSVETETGSQIAQISIPGCVNGGGNAVPSQYIWATKSSPHYVLIVYTSTSGPQFDPQQCPLTGNNGCTATIWGLNGNGSTKSPYALNGFKMAVDTSKATLAPGAAIPTGPGGGAAATAAAPGCEGSDALGWIICPVIDLLAKAIDGIYSVFIHPLLVTQPVGLSSSDAIYRIWSGFRNYGDIFLILALLVVVFGQSIGGGLIDAYSAKKILPRLLIAAVLINLSIYIVALAVDVSNIVGEGIQTLLTQPFVNTGTFHLTLNGGSTAVLGVSGLLAGTAGVAGLWVVIAGGATFILPMVQFILLFILLPGALVFISILATIIIRQGLIIFLLVVSPVAFALYALPNTEQYFRKWWDLLFKTLLIYPIIAVIFSIANIMSVTISEAAKSQIGLLSTLSQLMAIIALIIPLFLIPFAFRIAGSLLGRFHGVATGIHKRGQDTLKGNVNDANSLRNTTRRKVSSGFKDVREIRGSQMLGSNNRLQRRIGRSIGGVKLAENQAKSNAEREQAISNIWSNGNDTWTKASTIPISVLASRRSSGHRYRDAAAAGNTSGREQWAAADGTWHDEDQIKMGNREYFNGADKQVNYKKLLEKTEPLGTEAQNNVMEDYLAWANEAGLDAGTATGRWQGISIPLKGMRIDMRRAQIGGTPGNLTRTGTNHHALLTEYAGMAMPEQYKETPGSFQAIRDSIFTVAGNPHASQAENEAAARAYANLEQYVKGTSGSPQQQAAMSQQALAAQAAGAGGGAAAQQSYASSSSAAAKNRNAAQQALADIDTQGRLNPTLAQVIAQLPRDIT